MLLFDPPELRNHIAEALGTWEKLVGYDWDRDFSDDVIDVSDPDFNPAEYGDSTITKDDSFTLSLPRWEDEVRVTYGEFVELAAELQHADLRGNVECWTGSRLLVRVSPTNEEAYLYLYRTLPEAETEEERRSQLSLIEQRKKVAALYAQTPKPRDLAQDDTYDEELLTAYLDASRRERELSEQVEKSGGRYCSIESRSLDEKEVTCALVKKFTLFGPAIAASGTYDKYLPPVLDDDLFVEIRFSGGIQEKEARALFEAYVFELSSSLGVDLAESPRPDIVDEDPDLYDHGIYLSETRLRPLLSGKGMMELLALYNRAIAAPNEVKILYLTKVIEYVAQTVVEERANEAIRTKLLSSRSLNPDAAYLAELRAVVEEQRHFRKDREAVRQTTINCCEAGDLARLAPLFLIKLRDISPSDPPKKREAALAELGASLYATRNRIAHAKANYEPTGEECPEDQLADFVECAKLAAQQSVRWYHSRHEDARVLKGG